MQKRYRLALSSVLGVSTILAVLVGGHIDPSAHAGHGGDLLGVQAAFAQAASFLQTFDGTPATPAAWRPTTWDVQTNVTDSWLGDGSSIAPMLAQHSASCGAPPATHPINRIEDTVFICNDHVMTSMNAGYGAIYLTPNSMVDFATGEAVVKFDMSTFRTVGRDWVDLWITPFEDNLAVPLEDWGPAYQGEPRRAIHIRLDGSAGGTIFKGEVIRDFTSEGIASPEWRGYEQFFTPSSVRRDTFELRISRTKVRFGMPAYNVWWVDNTIADLGWTRGVVQFSHHAYNPTKGCDEANGGADPTGACANTWHWDNVNIAPAAPFTILRGAPRIASATATNQVNFPSPAPANAYLRFAGVGANLEASFNGGQTWQPVQRQAQEMNRVEHWSTYWSPIPAGVTSVKLRGQSTWAGSWVAQDIAIWAASPSAAPPATATPAATAAAASATPTRTPTATMPAATPTRTPTGATPAATPTRTPLPPPATGSQTVTFDDRSGQDQPLNGQYPTGVIDWGTGNWYHAKPWGAFPTKSMSFTSGVTSRSLNFVTPRRLVSVQAYNGETAPTTVTLSCAGKSTKTVTLAAGQSATISTGWTGTCATVTVSSTNGWGTNFDNLVIDGG